MTDIILYIGSIIVLLYLMRYSLFYPDDNDTLTLIFTAGAASVLVVSGSILTGNTVPHWVYVLIAAFQLALYNVARYRAARRWDRSFSHWRLIEKSLSISITVILVFFITDLIWRLVTRL